VVVLWNIAWPDARVANSTSFALSGLFKPPRWGALKCAGGAACWFAEGQGKNVLFCAAFLLVKDNFYAP